jgi:hypothetical protein
MLSERQQWLKARGIYTGEPRVSHLSFQFRNEAEYWQDMERLTVEALHDSAVQQRRLAQK